MLKEIEGIVFYKKDLQQQVDHLDRYSWVLALLALLLFIVVSSVCVHVFGRAACFPSH